jgi:hypothetical protein
VKKIILSAGMPRSGSTWLFNAARLLLDHQNNDNYKAVWIGNIEKQTIENLDNTLLIKIHNYDEALASKADLIIYSFRDIRDSIASNERKFTIKPSIEQADNLIELDTKWKQCADFILRYEDMMKNKQASLQQLARYFKLPASDKTIEAIQLALDGFSYNSSDKNNGTYNMDNLMHKNHITNGGYGTWKEQIDPVLITQIEAKYRSWFKTNHYPV